MILHFTMSVLSSRVGLTILYSIQPLGYQRGNFVIHWTSQHCTVRSPSATHQNKEKLDEVSLGSASLDSVSLVLGN